MKKIFSGFLPLAWPLGLFFIVVGAHWATFDKFGSDIPNWDQWDAEGVHLLAPWFEHDHFLAHLFHPHNEHRVVVTKLQNLVLTVANGQWDARLESVFNATLHAALAVAFWFAGRRWLAARWHAPLFLVLAALFAAPVAWQNVLGGFHSQQYWLLLFSFAAMVLLPFAEAWSGRWWLGTSLAAIALLTMGSGFFAALVVLAAVLWRWVRGETGWRAAWPTLVLMGALVAVGWLTRVEVDYHQSLKAKTASDFILSMVRSLQWPAPRAYSWLAIVLWLPWVLVTGRALRAPKKDSPALLIAALGGWVFAQIIATAYARGVGGDYPASRYMDTLAFGIAANALALGWLLSSRVERIASNAPSRLRATGSTLVCRIFALGWLGVFAWGVYDLAHLAIAVEMPDVKSFYVKAEGHMRGYLATHDPAQLAFPDIPYPSAEGLIDRLNHPSLTALMPSSIRAPLPVKAGPLRTVFRENLASQLIVDPAPQRGLSPDTAGLASNPTWGSFGAQGAATVGEWMSVPLPAPRSGWLKFETAGDLGREGVALELRDARSHALLATVQPSKIPGDNWRAAYVPMPRVPFVITARDESPVHWLAFSAPIEMGPLSYFAWQCTKNGFLVFEIAAGLTLALGLLALFANRRQPA